MRIKPDLPPSGIRFGATGTPAAIVENVAMPIYLQLATSIVLFVKDGDVSVGGTRFAFRQRHDFLTADHCVPEGTSVVVLQEPDGVQRPALTIDRNPQHDVALIRTAPLKTKLHRWRSSTTYPTT